MESLSNKNGKTPVASKDVQLNIWNSGYANPKNMYDLGYDLINTLEGSLYIVPSAGYYSDYLNSQNLYSNWYRITSAVLFLQSRRQTGTRRYLCDLE